MKKILLSMSMLGTLFAVGCSGSSGSSGTTAVNCSTDADCSGDICNTIGHVCMHQCTAATDCPSTEPTCAVVSEGANTAGSSTSVCQCTYSASTASCGSAGTCNPVDLLCEPACTQNSDCGEYSPARTCQGGVCLAGGTVADAGPGCDSNPALCTAGQICEPISGTCMAGVCGTADTLGSCQPGQYCDADTTCHTPLACSSAGGPAADTNSPLVWGVTVTGTNSTDANCQDTNGNQGTVTTFQGYYLNEGTGVVPTGTFSGSGNGSTTVWGNIGYVKPSGSTIYLTYAAATITDNTFTFQICNYTSGDGLHAGVVLMDGTAGGGSYNSAYSQVTPMADVSAAACLP